MLRMVEDDDAIVHQIRLRIRQDPALTALILIAVNSSFYNLRSPIRTVDRAIAFLGFNQLRSLIICLLIRRIVAHCTVERFPLPHFWQSSLCRAVASRHIARALGHPNPEAAYAVGLCQDLGVLLHVCSSPVRADIHSMTVGRAVDERRALVRAHMDGHEIVGSRWIAAWRCPIQIGIPTLFHHTPERAPVAYRPMARLAWAADFLTDLWFVKDLEPVIERAECAIEALGLSRDRLPSIVDDIHNDLLNSCILFGLPMAASVEHHPLRDLATTQQRSVA